MKHRNWFWGIFFLAAAIFIIAGQMGTFVAVGFWSIFASVLLAAVLIHSLADRNFFGIFVSAALLYLIYQKPLGWPAIYGWILILAAVLASIGCSMLLHPNGHGCSVTWNSGDKRFIEGKDRCRASSENIEGNDVQLKSSFSESYKYLHSDCLKSATLSSSFGKLGVYFDQVRLSPEGARVHVDVSFGTMVLFFPRGWRVIDQVQTSAGEVEDDMRREPVPADAPTLTLTGVVSFGSLEIHYV